MKEQLDNNVGFEKIPLKFHPRVFSALGADLVTNDNVAIIELVKNSYDAFAHNVWIRLKNDNKKGNYLEIEDDGQGMSKTIITDVWGTVATPYRELNPISKDNGEERRVAGEKGLGHLSVARLGNDLEMLTQSVGQPCWEAKINWVNISKGEELSSSFFNLKQYSESSPFKESGTLLKIFGLKNKWDDDNIADLEDGLSRLVFPFANVGEFNIYLITPKNNGKAPVKIEAAEFLSKPKYSITGKVDNSGNITCNYKFNPLDGGESRTSKLTYSWGSIYDSFREEQRLKENLKREKAECGSFDFEIRAWDLGNEDTKEIEEKFNFKHTNVRKTIGAYKGISVYRDSILILPKSDSARDWLGLDLRRVSDIGKRLSTSQLVGYVSITAEANSDIKDTSDRERLSSTQAVNEFGVLLKTIVSLLENERATDRLKKDKPKPLQDLFNQLKADKLLEDVTELTESGADNKEVLSVVRAYSETMEITRKSIQERFIYYSRLATIGTIAQILVHEIRNRTIALGTFFDYFKSKFSPPFQDKRLESKFNNAVDSACSLERLSDTFAPLASRNFGRRNRHSILEQRIQACIELQQGEISDKEIKCHFPSSKTAVAVDPGELDAILLNLITNSVYWLGEVKDHERILEFKLSYIDNNKRVQVHVHDNGSGIKKEDLEKIFWPGVTRKPGGIGMGLTVASELVAEYGGKMATHYPGVKGGATFVLDLPLQ